MEIRKIALVGPESTGKSTLSRALAEHFGARVCTEYAREYLCSGQTISHPKDLLELARVQQQREKTEVELLAHSPFLFCDTDLHNLVVWSQYAFCEVSHELAALEEDQKYSFYLLLEPDIPWVPDGIRAHPHLRNELYRTYRQRLEKKKRPFASIAGEGKARLEACLGAISISYQ